MIEITQEIETQVSANVAQRSRNCFVRRLSLNQYLVTPKPYSKSRRLVTFTLRHGRMYATCEDYRTGERCPANVFGVCCYHLIKALRHCMKLAKREERKAA